MTEAYSVGLDLQNYHATIPEGLAREQTLQVRENDIRENLVRYIGEYRLGVKFDEFFYSVGVDKASGEQFIATNEGMRASIIYRKAIIDRELKGLPVRRETAECLGFEKFEKGMLESPVGTIAIWVSPPGKKEEGYGDYSFTFLGQSYEDNGEKKIRMIPYRNTYCNEEHRNYLSAITGKDVALTTDSEFLATPFFIEQSEELRTPEDVLKKIGEKEKFDNAWYEKFTEAAWPLIQGFLYLVKTNAESDELKKALNALENFALAYKVDNALTLADEYVWEENGNLYDPHGHIGMYIDVWGEEEAPIVLGSCGQTGIQESREAYIGPMIPMQHHETFNKVGADEDKYGKREFDCPSCKKKIRRPVDTLVKKCPHMNCENPDAVRC